MPLEDHVKHLVRGLLEVRYYSMGRDWSAVEGQLDVLAADLESTSGEEVSVEEIREVLGEYREEIEKEGSHS